MADDRTEIYWDKLYAEVNAWRGECMHHIAVAERAVTETLLVLDGAKREGAKFPLRHLIGQRFEDISKATNADGPFAEEGKAAHKAIESYRQYETFRALLCHGVTQVTATRGGGWLLVIRSLSIRSKQAEETTAIVDGLLQLFEPFILDPDQPRAGLEGGDDGLPNLAQGGVLRVPQGDRQSSPNLVGGEVRVYGDRRKLDVVERTPPRGSLEEPVRL